MPSGKDPQHSKSDKAQEQLSDGLKSCRAVVKNYRLMLTGDTGVAEAAEEKEGATKPRAKVRAGDW